nr:DNA polymerase [Saccharomycopsis selenospora]
MDYHFNEDLAIENLIKELGEEDFYSIPVIPRYKLIERERIRLHMIRDAEVIEHARVATLQTRALLKSSREKYIKEDPTVLHRRRNIRIVKDSALKEVEPFPRYIPEAGIYTFRNSTLLSLKGEFEDIVDDIRNKKDFVMINSLYGFFYLVINDRLVYSSRSFGLHQDYFERSMTGGLKYFDNMVEKLVKDSYGYEEIFDENVQVYTRLAIRFTYIVNPKCIDNWGINQTELDLRFCKLFCASDTNIDCLVQCSNYLWNVDINNLDNFISYNKDKLVILEPKSYVNDVLNINSYYDLQVSDLSPNKYFDVFNYDIVLMYNEHMGVLHSFVGLFDLYKNTRRTPLKKSRSKFLTVVFDIECYFNPRSDSDNINIPYLCCYCYIIDNEPSEVYNIRGKDSILIMLNNIVEYCTTNCINKVELIAHNGGNYDFHYIISSLVRPSIIKDIILRNNSFISFTFVLETVKFCVKDSYAFLLCSLSNAAKAFLNNPDIGKTDFPHHEVQSEKDLDRVFNKWSSVDENINIKYDKNNMMITSDNIIKYKDKSESKKLIDWSIEYCVNDVIVLADVWIAFKQATKDIFGVAIVDTSYTLAGMSFNLFKANLFEGIYLYHPSRDDYFNLRSALYGGRCVSSNGVHKNVICLDVKSLYPAAMSFYNQPYGEFYKVKKRDKDRLGVYYVTVIPTKNPKSNFFPLKNSSNEVSYYLDGVVVYQSWYTSVDIDIGVNEGHNIMYTSFDSETGDIGYEWESKGKIFLEYIQNVLYKYKLQFEQENNKVKRQVIKIIMNSLWGKFAQKWLDDEHYIKHTSEVNFDEEESYVIWDTDYSLVKNKLFTEFGSKPIQNGLFTLSWSRYHMKKIWDACVEEGTECLYSDTDSIFVSKEDFNTNAEFILNSEVKKVIGDDIGQLEIEAELDILFCAGKKQYYGYNSDMVTKKRFKGIPSKYIVPEMYSFLLESKDHRVQVEFLKLKKIWGAVKGYMENKTVKAT